MPARIQQIAAMVVERATAEASDWISRMTPMVDGELGCTSRFASVNRPTRPKSQSECPCQVGYAVQL